MAERGSPWSRPLLELIQAVPCGLLVVARDGTIELANPSASRLFGYRQGELEGRSVEELVDPGARGEHAAARARFAGAEEARPMGGGRVVKGRRKSGEPVLVEIGLSPWGSAEGRTIATVVDVGLLAANADGLAVIAADGRLLYTNPAAARLLAEATRQGVPIALPRGPGETVEIETRLEAGSRRWIEVRTSAIPWGGRDEVLASLRDVTDRRLLQEQLQERRRTAIVGRLAAGVAHEFNNALQAILAGVDEAEAADPEERAGIFAGMRRAARRSANLTRRLMDLGGVAFPGPMRVDIDEAVDALLPALRELAGAGIELDHRPMGFPLEAAIAQGQLAQLLMELVANCAEAIGPTGRIEIAAGEVPGGPGSCHCDPPISLEGPHLALLVRDDGPGVPPPLRDAIFDPFFTTKPGTATTGLGLTACRSIASRARGHVCCDLGDGPGATFRVLLPLAGDDDPLAITGSQERPVGVRLLLVDDEPMIRTLIARHLQRTGFDVEQAADGEEALAHLAAGAPFDLLVTDVVMPGLDGFELALEARRRQPDLPILFISGCSVTSVQAEPDPTLHPIELLAKPFGMDELARRVRGVLSARLEGAEAPRTPLPAQR